MKKTSKYLFLALFLFSILFFLSLLLFNPNYFQRSNERIHNKREDLHSSKNFSELWSSNKGDWIVSSAAIGDIDNDNKMEVIFGCHNKKVYALEGENGQQKWAFPTGALISSSPALGDIDDDGKLEVVIVSNDNKIYALKGENGAEQWNYTTGSHMFSLPSLADIDGDNTLEVLISCEDDNIYALNGENGTKQWNYSIGHGEIFSPTLGDLDGDGKIEVIALQNNNIYALNGENGTKQWNYSLNDNFDTSPVLGDIDDDKKLEIIVITTDGVIHALNGENGTIIWSYTTGIKGFAMPALGDIDEDGTIEVVINNDDYYSDDTNSKIFALNGKDGKKEWIYTLDDFFYDISPPSLGDIDGDKRLEVIFGGGYFEKIFALNGENGTIVWSHDIGKCVRPSPALGDINNDDKLEIVIGSDNGRIYAFRLNPTGSRVYWQGLSGDNTFSRINSQASHDPDFDMLSNYTENFYNTSNVNDDTDSDGMPDGWEFFNDLNGTNGLDNTTDNDEDGLMAIYEFGNGTLANDPDTDSDGMPDGWEVHNDLDPTYTLDNTTDNDEDGLIAMHEFGNGTSPNDPDTDSDGMPDIWEVHNDLNGTDGLDNTTDNDEDGLMAIYEFGNGTLANDPDTDDDNLFDGTEINYNCNPLDNDTDSDKLLDGEEVYRGKNGFITDPTDEDTDSDKLGDWEEIYKYHTDPTDSDTDNDGYSDGAEIKKYGTDPNSDLSSPSTLSLLTIFIVLGVVLLSISIIGFIIVRKKKSRQRLISKLKNVLYKQIERNISRKKLFHALESFNELIQVAFEKDLEEVQQWGLNRSKELLKLAFDRIEVLYQEFQSLQSDQQYKIIFNNIPASNYLLEEMDSFLKNCKSLKSPSLKGFNTLKKDYSEKAKQLKKLIFKLRKQRLKKLISDFSVKFSRLGIHDISERCEEPERFAISVIKEMIREEEIYGNYFETSKAIVFNQQANIQKIDELMESFKRREEVEFGKKLPKTHKKIRVENEDITSLNKLPSKSFNFKNNEKDFLFVSYALEDKNQVFPEIKYLQDKGFNIFFDEGIQVNSNWTINITNAIKNCSNFIVFISRNSVTKKVILTEINYALNHKKPILLIFLEKIELPKGLKLRVNTKQYLKKYELNESYFRKKLFKGLGNIKNPKSNDISD